MDRKRLKARRVVCHQRKQFYGTIFDECLVGTVVSWWILMIERVLSYIVDQKRLNEKYPFSTLREGPEQSLSFITIRNNTFER